MAKMRLLRTQIIDQLMKNIPINLERYRSGTFPELATDSTLYIEIDKQFDEDELSKVDCDIKDHKEVDCCLQIYKSLKDINPYIAGDPRLWAYFAHTSLLGYSRKRWPIPGDKESAIAHISKHFFATGSRGIERENAVSRLWWMAKLCSCVKDLTLREALTSFLYFTDVRASVIERPTTAQNQSIMTSLVKKLHESYKGDKTLFERSKFRSIMKNINLKGGIKLLAVLGETEINHIIDESIN